MYTNPIAHAIHPTNYAPIRALRQQRPEANDAQEVIVTVDVAGSGLLPLTFRWRADLNCWQSTQLLCISC